MHQPWKTDKWFSSPWCYLPEVRQNDTLSRRTSRFTTSRCATASSRPPSCSGARRRWRSRRSSTRSGVHRIEAGMPAVSEQDKAAISGHRRARAEGRNLRLRPLHPGRDQGGQGVRLLGRGHRDSRQRPHDQERLRLDRRSRDEGLDRDDARGQRGRPLHRLLHHRRHAHRAQSLPRHRRAGRDRRPHGRVDHRRHDGRVHAGRGRLTS